MIYYLDERLWFPSVEEADDEGLLAIGGDLSLNRLMLAYKSGIFPWFNHDDYEILWWSPDPRFVLYPNDFKSSKSFRQELKSKKYTCTFNKDFASVVSNCKKIERKDQESTWITDSMEMAYNDLFKNGDAISVEVWDGEELVGGLYGVKVGVVFCGESMFSRVNSGSKYALYQLCIKAEEMGVELIDCQVYTKHLASLGAKMINRKQFLKLLPD